MEALLFLFGAFGFVVLGTTVIAVRHRQPRGFDYSVKEFRREMAALSPVTRDDDAVDFIDPLTGPEPPAPTPPSGE